METNEASNPSPTDPAERVAALEKERDEARRERDEARRETEATERRVVSAIAGELVGLARRARAEYAQRLGRGEGSRYEYLPHHAQAFEWVAVELARKFGGEVAEAIAPPAAPVETSAPAAVVQEQGPAPGDEAPQSAPSRWSTIEVD